jgi:hypothetical protein
MKLTTSLLLFVGLMLSLTAFEGCKKASKTRLQGYKCYLWEDVMDSVVIGKRDTILVSVADFPYPSASYLPTPQAAHDTFYAHNKLYSWMWYECHY